MYKRLMIPMIVLLAANLFVTWVVPEAKAWRYYRSIESAHYWGVACTPDPDDPDSSCPVNSCDPTTEFCPDSAKDQIFGVSLVDGEYVASCKMDGLVFCDPLASDLCPMQAGAADLGENDFVSGKEGFTIIDSEAGTTLATTTAKLGTGEGQALCDEFFGAGTTVYDKFWPQDENDNPNEPDFFAHTTFYDSVSGDTGVLDELCKKPEVVTDGEIVAVCESQPFKVPCCDDSENILTVDVEGHGTVTSPAGINCNEDPTSDCIETFNHDNPGYPVYDTCPLVELTATAECEAYGSCYEFTGWSGGGCSGTDPVCTDVATQGSPTVTATFEAKYHTLTVIVDGDGKKDKVWLFDPRVDFDDSDPLQDDLTYCLGTCHKQLVPGTPVTVKRKGGTWSEWGGDCTGTPNSDDTCTFVMTESVTVEALFIN